MDRSKKRALWDDFYLLSSQTTILCLLYVFWQSLRSKECTFFWLKFGGKTFDWEEKPMGKASKIKTKHSHGDTLWHTTWKTEPTPERKTPDEAIYSYAATWLTKSTWTVARFAASEKYRTKKWKYKNTSNPIPAQGDGGVAGNVGLTNRVQKSVKSSFVAISICEFRSWRPCALRKNPYLIFIHLSLYLSLENKYIYCGI